MDEFICPISGEHVEKLIGFKNQPVFMGTTTDDSETDLLADMVWGATKSGIVHLMERIPLEVLYSKSHNSGVIGKMWHDHHSEFASFIAKFKPQSICEIGGGHGKLAQLYSTSEAFKSWEIFEPNANFPEQERVFIRNEIFSEQTSTGIKDCFVHSHLFEHLYDHRGVLKLIHSRLSTNGHMIFSVPNMKQMVQRNYINALNFEHVTYLPEDLVDYLLEIEGFEIVQKSFFHEDHSIFYSCKKIDKPKGKLKRYQSGENANDVLRFFGNIQRDIDALNRCMAATDADVVFLFGAHIFSQFYLANGLYSPKVKSILDNDPNKQGKRLYGTSLPVASPEIIKEFSNPLVILNVGAYRDEIAQQLVDIHPSVQFVD
jgi:hypothetical protein